MSCPSFPTLLWYISQCLKTSKSSVKALGVILSRLLWEKGAGMGVAGMGVAGMGVAGGEAIRQGETIYIRESAST